jgi:hypothetical protein
MPPKRTPRFCGDSAEFEFAVSRHVPTPQIEYLDMVSQSLTLLSSRLGFPLVMRGKVPPKRIPRFCGKQRRVFCAWRHVPTPPQEQLRVRQAGACGGADVAARRRRHRFPAAN